MASVDIDLWFFSSADLFIPAHTFLELRLAPQQALHDIEYYTVFVLLI